jgi:hypothetical protein
MHSDDEWTDWDAGPVARPYTVTGGRTRSASEHYFDLIDLVGRTRGQDRRAGERSSSPERSRILGLCQTPVTVAELASQVALPLGVVRVLLGDLVQEGLIEVRVAAPRGRMTDRRVLRQVLDGLHAL